VRKYLVRFVLPFIFLGAISLQATCWAFPLTLTYQLTEISPSLYQYDFDLQFVDDNDPALPPGTVYNIISFGEVEGQPNDNLLTDWTFTSTPSPFSAEFDGLVPPRLVDRTGFILSVGFIPTTIGDSLQWSGTSTAELGSGELFWRKFVPNAPNGPFLAVLDAPPADRNIWDTNGDGLGSGTLGGNWSDTNWTNDSTGNSATGTFAGTTAIFSAGENATTPFEVNVDVDVTLTSVVIEEGNVTFVSDNASKLNLGGSELNVPLGQELSLGLSTTGVLTKVGVGLLRLNNPNGFAAEELIVNEGTVRWMAPEQIQDRVYVGANGTVDLNGQQQTLSSFTNDGGTFLTGQGGELIGTGNTITFTGGSTNIVGAGGLVQDANFTIDNAGGVNSVLGDGGSTLGGGSIDVLASGGGLQMGGGGSVVIDLAADAVSAGSLQLAGDLTVNGSTDAQISSSGVGAAAGLVNLIGTPNISVETGSSLDISAILNGSGFNKTGDGTLTLSNVAANSYTGLISANAGMLELNGALSNNSTITGDLNIGSNGGVVLLKSHQISDSSIVTADGLFNVGGKMETVGRILGSNGEVRSNGGSLTVDSAQSGDAFSGVISGTSGTLTLFGTGAGSWELGGNSANTFEGATVVANGKLILNKSTGNAVAGDLNIGDGNGSAATAVLQLVKSNQIADTSNVLINSDGQLQRNSQVEAINNLTLAGGSIVENGTLSIGGDVTTSGVSTIGGGSLNFIGNSQLNVVDSLTIHDPITSTNLGNTLVKNGAGRLVLTGSTSTFAHALDIVNGIVEIQAGGALGAAGSTATGTVVRNGATLEINGGTGINIGNESLSLNGTGSGNGALINAAGNNVWNGNITISSDATINVQSSTSLEVAGNILGSGEFRKIGDGVFTLAGSGNSYSGNTLVQTGTLKFSSGSDFTNSPLVDISGGSTLDLTAKPLTTFATTASPANADRVLKVNGTVLSGGLQFLDQSSASINPGSLVQVGNFATSDGNVELLGDDLAVGPTWTQTGGTVEIAGSLLLQGADTAYSLNDEILNLSADTPTISGPLIPGSPGDSTPGQIVGSGQFRFSGGRLEDVNYISLTDTATSQSLSPQLTAIGAAAGGLLQSGGVFELGDADDVSGHQTVVEGFFDQQRGILEVDIFLIGNSSGVEDDEDADSSADHTARDQFIIYGDAFLNGKVIIDFNALTANEEEIIPWADRWNVLHVIDDDPTTLDLILGDNFRVEGALHRVSPDGNGGYFLQVLVPEPTSVLIWSTLLMGAAFQRRRARRR
jgi:autotransporter-associated beta strand protein